jgi:hypothetical protein
MSLFPTPPKVQSPSSLFSAPPKNALAAVKPAVMNPAVKPPSSLASNGVKATAPGASTQGIVNKIKPTYVAPQQQQTSTSNQGTQPSNLYQPNTGTQPDVSATIPSQTPTFGGIIGSLVNTAQNGSQAVSQGQTQLADAIKRQQQLESGIQGQYGAIESQAIPLEFQQGREQALARQYAGQEAAAQGAVTQQQTALGQALTGQGQQISGLQGAAQLSAPSLGSIGAVPFSPLTQNQGSALGTQQYGSLPAAGQALGAFNGAQALGAAPYQAQASNIGTAGTATTGAANTAYQQYYGQSLATNTALNQVQSLGNLALQTVTGGNINPLQVAAGNQTLAQFKRQLSSPSQAVFDQTMATFQGALSTLLSGSADVTPTQISAWTTQISNGSMPLATLQAIYQQGIKEGNLKLSNINAAGASAYSQLQGQGGGHTGNSSIGNSWNF